MRVLKTLEKRDSRQFAVVCEAALGESLRVRFRADGQSMQPNVLDGDTVVIAPISAGKPQCGDIALTRGDRGFVLHRVVGFDAVTGAIVTRGDSGQANDPCVTKVLGKAVAIERDGKTISLTARGTALRHSVRTQSHRLRRQGIRFASYFRSAIVPAVFMLFAFLVHASGAGAQTTLTVSDAGAPNPVATGANITFTQKVVNTTGTAATGASLTQTTPAHTVFESMTPPANWTCGTLPAVGGTGTVTCTLNVGQNVAGNATLTFLLVVQADPEAGVGSTITNNVTVSWTGPAPGGTNNGNASVTVAGADLAMTQVASTTAAAPGSTITYTETVTNNGPDSATTAVLYQETPPNTTFSSITAPGGWNCTSPAVGGTGQIVCTDSSALTSGTTTTAFTFVVTINPGPTPAAPVAGTTIINSADVTSATTDSVPSNNSTLTSVLVEDTGDSDLSLSMSVSATPVFVSTPISYTIQIQNLGLSAGTGVTVVDTLPASLTGASATTTAGSCGAPSGGTITCNLGTVAYPLGTPITITVSGTSSSTATSMTNSATVSTTGTDPVSSNNSVTILTVVQPLVCSTPGKDGAGGTLSGVVNTYFPPGAGVAGAAAGTTSIVLGAAAGAPAAQTPIAIGDRLLIIQMQNATINSTNTSSYGDGVPGDPGSGSTSLGSSGLFEYVTATSAVPVTGGTLSFTGSGTSGGLVNSYVEAAAAPATNPTAGQSTFQVIRVPQYTTATLSSSLDGLSWNGSVGGVLVLDVATHLTLGGTVALDGQGFRGGAGQILTAATTPPTPLDTDYVTLSTQTTNGPKGEGIAGTPKTVANATLTTLINTGNEGYPNGSFARGAPGNAGGGGTDVDPTVNTQNDGGGGGGNGGGGGIGGFGWNSAGIFGGFGGVAFPTSMSSIVMGGGAGSGTTNNGSFWNPSTDTGGSTSNTCPTPCTGINSSGTAGGGIVIIHAGTVTGTGTITSNGQDALETENDGGGGGGAGGTIIFLTNNGGVSVLTVSAVGGNGGVTWPEQAPGTFPGNRHGPGGGGGGGVIFTSSAPAGASVIGGANGWSTLADDAYGSTTGSPGLYFPNTPVQGNPGAQSGAYCATADLAVTNSGAPSPVVPGNNITYTQTVMNNGPVDGINATMTEVVPTNTTFQSIVISGSGAAGWSCSTPAVNGTGVITCTDADIPAGASGAATFTVVVNVNAGTATGTQIADTISATSDTNDPNLSNNSATVLTIVGAANTANLALTNVGTPNPVLQGNNITYTVVITNNGPGTSNTVAFTEPTPTNTTFVSVAATSGTAGWTCSAVSISCTIPSFASGASTTFTVVVTVGGAVPSGTIITDTATVSAATTDPNPSNNVATVTTVVATAGQADLAVTKTGTPTTVLAGNKITYTVVVTNNGPAAASSPVLTDTFSCTPPSGPPTYVCMTVTSTTPLPAGWTCNAPSGGQFTCNGPGSMAANTSATFTFVMTVTAGTAPGTKVNNTASIGPTANDPNTSNNTASAPPSTVASPSQSDVAILKSASPEPVNQGTNLTYTLQVTNNGPAVATGVAVTDILPTQVTFTSVSIPASQGSCTYTAATTTVNCTLNNMNVGNLVIITINVTAATFSSNTLSSNTATVSSTTSDPNLTNNSSTAISTIEAATAVQLTSFLAQTLPGGGVLLSWQTSEETRNLGFYVYRGDAQGRQQINPSLIAGSALFMRGGQPQHRGKTYQWIDAQGSSLSSYWLEDVDLNGTRTLHGPIYAESSATVQEPIPQARLLRQLNQLATLAAPPAVTPAGAGLVPSPSVLSAASEPSSQIVRALNTPQAIIPQVAPGENPASLNGDPAVKISVTTEGWYQVSRNQLVAAGMPANTDARLLELYAEGIEQPIRILGRQSGPLGTSDSIEFYGTGIDTPFSGTRVYWLVRGSHAGKRIASTAASGHGEATEPSFPFTVLFEQRTTYFAALLNGIDNDNFFGAIVTTDPVEQDITVAHVDPTSSLPVTLSVTLQGVTDQQAHSVSIAFNGTPVGEIDYANMTNATQSFAVSNALLQNGSNTVTLTALNGDNDVNLVQSITIQYAHTYAADSDWLRATASSGDTVRINGFSNAQIEVFDITDPLNISQLTGPVTSDTTGFGITLSIPGARGTERTLLAFSSDQISAPAGLALHAPNALDKAQSGADLVVISYPDFAASAAPLVKLHQSKSRSVDVVTVDQLYDAFNYGEKSPQALLDYLELASTSWRTHPQAVLLVGDASFDPRNYLGFGESDFVPTRMIETAAFKTGSDDWFTDFKQTGFGTIPIGRLPVSTTAEGNLVVSKIVGYELGTSAGSWNQQALVIADQNVGADFTATANAASTEFPASLSVTKILADGQDPSVIKPQILAALNSGALVVNYIGHGSEEQWSFEDLFDETSVASLTNGDRLPVYVLMDCLNGFFQDVYATSLSTTLMVAPNGGAVAVWASSGFTDAAPQATMDQALLGTWKANPSQPIGAVTLAAKLGVVDPDVRRTWNLFGDPLMSLQIAGSNIPSHMPRPSPRTKPWVP